MTIKKEVKINEDKFDVERMFDRVSIVIEEFDGVSPKDVGEKSIYEYYQEVADYAAKLEFSPTHVILHRNNKLEFLFSPIMKEQFEKDSIYKLAFKLQSYINSKDRISGYVPDSIFSDYKPPLSDNELYYLFTIGLMENTEDWENINLEDIFTPSDTEFITYTDEYGLDLK